MPGKVLVADDSLRIQKELTQLLQGAGIEVVAVSNGEYAVRKLTSVQPDLVLADLFMPVRSGYEVCEYIKNNPELAHITVLLLVSKLEPFDEKEAQRVRADGKLEKPLADPAGALTTIKQHLEKALGQKAAAPGEEVATTAPAEPQTVPEAEPEPEAFGAKPRPVTFDEQAAPMGFTEILEEVGRVEEPPSAPAEAPAESEKAGPAAEVAPAEEETRVEKPELAPAWEMTGPEPGAPEIPAAGGWESQWSAGAEEAAQTAEAPPAEEAPPAAEQAAPPAEEVAPAAAEEPAPVPPSAPEDFAAAFGGASAEPATEEVKEPPTTEVKEEAPVAAPAAEVAEEGPPAAPGLDPAVIDEVVNRVVERLSPQVTETIAREIVRPLAEALLKEKLKD